MLKILLMNAKDGEITRSHIQVVQKIKNKASTTPRVTLDCIQKLISDTQPFYKNGNLFRCKVTWISAEDTNLRYINKFVTLAS